MTDVFIICFNVISPDSYANVRLKVSIRFELFSFSCSSYFLCRRFIQWAPEITHHSERTPYILVGTQIDLRDDPDTLSKLSRDNKKPLTAKQGEKLANDIKAVEYLECSAKTQV